jgi:hypothetical protein
MFISFLQIDLLPHTYFKQTTGKKSQINLKNAKWRTWHNGRFNWKKIEKEKTNKQKEARIA